MAQHPPISPQPIFTPPPPKQVCPVCGGRGHVMRGFYASVQTETFTTAGGTESCRACGGRGIV
jgi:hypothetical protein